jgi:hypothetical protein
MSDNISRADTVHKPDYSYEADMVRRLKESQKGSYTGFCKSQLITCNFVKACNGVCPFEDALKHADKEMDEQTVIDHDRDWIIGCIKHDGFIKTDRFDKANQIILDALSAEAVQGEWILVKGNNGKDYHKCSKCLHTQEITGVKNYCAVCGARMKGGAE